QALEQSRLFGVAQRKPFVLCQALLGQSKYLGTHQSRNRDLNPLTALLVLLGTGPSGKTSLLSQRSGDSLPCTRLCFAKASLPLISGISQHGPNRGALPRPFAKSSRNLLAI